MNHLFRFTAIILVAAMLLMPVVGIAQEQETATVLFEASEPILL